MPSRRDDVLALSWFRHRRTEEICRHFGWPTCVLETPLKGIWRYCVLAPRSLWTLLKRRPRVLIVQNPSLILTVLTVLLRPLLRFRLVVDAHNEAVTPYLFDNATVRFAARQCLKRAALTIVTNESLARIVRDAGGRPFVLPDAIPHPPPGQRRISADSPCSIAVISTFAPDEPLECIFEAARALGSLATFKVTGNVRKLPAARRQLAPGNVEFTGFLSEPDYWQLLRDSGAVLDLSEMPDCLVCGAYEAVSVERPLILTGSQAARDWFGTAAVYVKNEPAEVEAAVRSIASQLPAYELLAGAARGVIEAKWRAQAAALPRAMGALATQTA